MRLTGCTLASLIAAAPLLAQQPPAGRPTLNPAGQAVPAIPTAAPALNPNDKLDSLLMQWEQKMKSIESLVAKCERTEPDPDVKGRAVVYVGWAKFQRPARAHLYMEKKGSNGQIYERYLSTGTFVYDYRPAQKVVRIYEMPQRGPGQGPIEDNFLSFLFGMEAREAKTKYAIELVKTDQHYYYLIIKPRFPKDQADFTEARVVLWVNTLLPRQMSFLPPNGAEVKWDIPQMDTTVRFNATDFQPPQMPRDWQVIKVPPAGQQPAGPAPATVPPPSKVRPSGQ